jgi:CubicO group peptidase (beta-lactamase class C family)
LRSEAVVDVVEGVARREPPASLGPSTPVPWFSASKLLSTIGVARAWEDGAFGLDDRVADHLPAFAGGGKDDITIRHLWTHTAPLVGADRAVNTTMTRQDALKVIYASHADPDWTPGERASYLGHVSMLLLAEVVAASTGTALAQVLDEQVTGPLRLSSGLGLPRAGEPVEVPDINRPSRAIKFNPRAGFPGNGVIGPFGEAAVLADVLLSGGVRNGHRVLRPQTVAAVVTRQRTGLVDQAHGVPLDWGLGVAIDNYMFGRHCSAGTFGSVGATSSMVFADPAHHLSAAVFFNGNCGFADHVRRAHMVATAIYTDLGLVSVDDPGRDHVAPLIGVL